MLPSLNYRKLGNPKLLFVCAVILVAAIGLARLIPVHAQGEGGYCGVFPQDPSEDGSPVVTITPNPVQPGGQVTVDVECMDQRAGKDAQIVWQVSGGGDTISIPSSNWRIDDAGWGYLDYTFTVPPSASPGKGALTIIFSQGSSPPQRFTCDVAGSMSPQQQPQPQQNTHIPTSTPDTGTIVLGGVAAAVIGGLASVGVAAALSLLGSSPDGTGTDFGDGRGVYQPTPGSVPATGQFRDGNFALNLPVSQTLVLGFAEGFSGVGSGPYASGLTDIVILHVNPQTGVIDRSVPPRILSPEQTNLITSYQRRVCDGTDANDNPTFHTTDDSCIWMDGMRVTWKGGTSLSAGGLPENYAQYNL